MRLIALAVLLLPVAVHAHDPARATYVGNEGVLVARGETKVLFDAFYDDSYGEYLTVSPETRAAMMKGDAPYDGVDAVFVSHVHGDHFSPGPMVDYLRAQGDVVLYAPMQAKRAILASGVDENDPIMKRIHAIDMTPADEARHFSIDGIAIDVVSVLHAGDRKDVQNYSWRATLDDETTVIHFGDAGAVTANFERHRKHFSAREHDAAFPPYWWYVEESGRTLLNDLIRAKQTIGVHAPASTQGKGDATRADLGGDVFTDPGETRDID